MKVVVFASNCGATTGFSTQVSLLLIDAKLPNEGGNVFVSDTDHGAAPSGLGGGPEIRVEWQSSDQVLISHHPKARVFKSEGGLLDVTFHYQPFLDEQ